MRGLFMPVNYAVRSFARASLLPLRIAPKITDSASLTDPWAEPSLNPAKMISLACGLSRIRAVPHRCAFANQAR